MTVQDNLEMGAFTQKEVSKEDLERMFTLFPRLKERRRQIADRAYVLETGRITLSGTGAELSQSDEVRKAYLGG